MRKHVQRRRVRRAILAANRGDVLLRDTVGMEWIEAAAAEGAAQAPKRFKIRAYTGGPMQVGYYAAPVVIDLAGLQCEAPLPILLNHDPNKIVGHADEIAVSQSALDLSGVVTGASPEADQVVNSSKLGFPWKASVGARPDKMDFVGEGESAEVNGKKHPGPLYVARKSTLGEVSFVAMAADGQTRATVAAIARPAVFNERNLTMEFSEWAQARGIDLNAESDQAKKFLREIFAEESGKKIMAGSPPPPFDLSAFLVKYERHAADLQAKASEYAAKVDSAAFKEIQAKASRALLEAKSQGLSDQWTADRLEAEATKIAASMEVELIRAARPKAPAIHGSSSDATGEVIQAAFLRTAGMPDLDKQFKPEVLEASDRYRGLGLQELLLNAAVRGGYAGRMKMSQTNVKEILRAAFSTHEITTLLTQLGHKTLLSGFYAVPQTWREVATIRTVSDFKQITAFRMTADLEYTEVAPAGEIEHGSLGQESYTMQARTYAKMLTLTRTDLVNDDLGAFNDIRNRLGIGAALKVNKEFWTCWLAASNGGAFWTGARGNLVTSSPLGETGLNNAVAAFRKLTGPDGNPLNLNPDRMIVPVEIEATALKWMNSTEIRDTTASTKTPTSNIYQGRFRPIPVPELSLSSLTGYSATTWYLMSDPAVLASAAVCYLDGVQTPVIESADADFNVLGIQFRGYHDFGVQMSEWRASVKATA